jgi:NADH-quinone oxidoreductase subunit F
LAVESCGQCSPCKLDGLRISELLDGVRRSEAGSDDLDELRARIATVADGARCSLAIQQQTVVTSLLDMFPEDVDAHLSGKTPSRRSALVAELVDIEDGVARIDEHHLEKQPDWTYDATDSGKTPAERLGEHREPEQLDV